MKEITKFIIVQLCDCNYYSNFKLIKQKYKCKQHGLEEKAGLDPKMEIHYSANTSYDRT